MPLPTLKISAAGLRGVVGQSLTPQLVTSYAAAFGNYCTVSGSDPAPGAVLVAADDRLSSQMIQQAVVAGLSSVGNPPVELGAVPLPALMWYVRETGARGAINIGGPRPAQGFRDPERAERWTAIRFIGPDGNALRPTQAAELTDLFHQGVYTRVAAASIPAVTADGRAVERHRAAVLSAVDVDRIRARRLRVALDPGEGPCALASPPLLHALGCVVIPAATGQLPRTVREQRADVGFLQDADGDRLALVDQTGEALVEDATLALAVEHWLRRDPGPVVVSASTSEALDEIAARAQVPLVRTPVGEAQVADRMRALSARIGGEGDGGVILAPVNPCRDSFVAMALALDALASDPAPLSARIAAARRRVLLRDSLLCPPREVAPALRWLRHVYRGQKFDLTDGLKVSWVDRWLHVRPSHSDPLMRVTVEAPTAPEARKLLAEVIAQLSPEG